MPRLTESGFFMHSLAWFVAALVGFQAFVQNWATLFFLLLYSTALEYLQYFIPYRTFNIMDIIANVCGLALWLAAALFLRRFKFFTQLEDAKSK